MRKEYYEIYRNLGNLYHQNNCLNESNIIKYTSDPVSLIEKIIDGVVSDLNIEECLRPDARHFLVVNFHQMILLPLMNSGDDKFPNIDEILHIISEDIRTILYSAKNLAGNGKEISGGKILKSASLCYDDLYISGIKWKEWLRLWG